VGLFITPALPPSPPASIRVAPHVLLRTCCHYRAVRLSKHGLGACATERHPRAPRRRYTTMVRPLPLLLRQRSLLGVWIAWNGRHFWCSPYCRLLAPAPYPLPSSRTTNIAAYRLPRCDISTKVTCGAFEPLTFTRRADYSYRDVLYCWRVTRRQRWFAASPRTSYSRRTLSSTVF